MREDRRAAVPAVAALDAELACKQRVSPGGVDEEPRSPAARWPIFIAALGYGTALIEEIDVADPAPFNHFRALGAGVVEQDLIELGSPHVVGIGQ